MTAANTTRFLKVKSASEVTGLSQFFIRNGVRDGSIPHIRSGRTIYVDVEAMMKILCAKESNVSVE